MPFNFEFIYFIYFELVIFLNFLYLSVFISILLLLQHLNYHSLNFVSKPISAWVNKSISWLCRVDTPGSHVDMLFQFLLTHISFAVSNASFSFLFTFTPESCPVQPQSNYTEGYSMNSGRGQVLLFPHPACLYDTEDNTGKRVTIDTHPTGEKA